MSDRLSAKDALAMGAAVRTTRQARQINQEVLADAVGVSRETISRLEGGRAAYLSTLIKVAAALDVSVEQLYPPGAARRISPFAAIGTALRARRESQKLTVAECASRAQVSPSALSKFERGMPCRKLATGTKLDPYQSWPNRDYRRALGFQTVADLMLYIAEASKQLAPPRHGDRPIDPATRGDRYVAPSEDPFRPGHRRRRPASDVDRW